MRIQLFLFLHTKILLFFTHLIFVDPDIKINGAIIGTCCWNMRCCPISAQFLATASFFSRLVHTLAQMARETVVFTAARGSGFQCSQSVASHQLRPQPCWLHSVGYDHGYDAGPRLSGEVARRWRSEVAFDWRVGQSGAKRHRQRDRPVAFTTSCLCPCERGTFQ